jgi:hypothetical protein
MYQTGWIFQLKVAGAFRYRAEIIGVPVWLGSGVAG